MHDQTIQNLLTVKGGASKVPHLWEDLLEVDGCWEKESYAPRDVAIVRLLRSLWMTHTRSHVGSTNWTQVLLITEEHKKEDMERVERWGWGPLRGKRGVVGGCNHCTSYKCMKLSKNKRYSFKKLNLPKGFSMSLFCSGLVQKACCPHLSKIKRYWLQLVDKSYMRIGQNSQFKTSY